MTAVRETQTRPEVMRRSEAPFLLWPVGRREFYMSIAVALLLPLAWGIMIFGWRVLWMLVVAVTAAWITHYALARWTVRGRMLVLAHTMVAVLVMAALCHPLWPWWLVALAAAAIPAALWALGGPGHERVHIGVATALLIQVALIPWIAPSDAGEAILARDRLVMGDIANQREGTLYRWPQSVSIAGYDAVAIRSPAHAALETLDRLTATLSHAIGPGREIDPAARKTAQSLLDDAFVNRLPSVEMLVGGAHTGPIGTVSLIALACGGLYLAYRFILRPRSLFYFLASYIVAMTAMALSPGAVGRLGFTGIWAAWMPSPGEIATLLSYAIFNGDVVFAAIILLALPGTEPLTGRGRRVFLIAAGIFAAVLARMNWGLPAASLALCAFMPLAPACDRWFGKRSWLNRLGF